MSGSELFLIDKAHASLASLREGGECPPRAVGLWTLFRLVNRTPGYYPLYGCLSVLLAPFGLFFFALSIRAIRREYRLHRRGRVIVGEVVSFGEVTVTGYEQGPEGIQGAPTSWAVPTVGFSFPRPGGRVLTSWASIEPRKSSEMPPRLGQHMAVLYLDDENYQVL